MTAKSTEVTTCRFVSTICVYIYYSSTYDSIANGDEW